MRSRYFSAIVVALVAMLVLAPASAFGWNNGPDGADSFGTHDWIVREANAIALKYGISWVNVNVAMAASDDPDTVFGDQQYHNYNVSAPDHSASSPQMVMRYYDLAVDSLRRGDSYTASYYLGLLSHYLSDTWNPLHTDNSAAEDSMHASFEAAVESQILPSAYGMDYGFSAVSDPYMLTEWAAINANRNYWRTVNDYIAYGMAFDRGAAMSANISLAMAVNDLQRVIRCIQADAVLDQTPYSVYRFYRPQSGTHFYTASYAEAVKVIGRLSTTYRYEGASYVANPALNTRPLYRFYNPSTGAHLYTAEEGEKSSIIANLSPTYTYEGIAYHVSSGTGTQVHRFYSPGKNAHFYSANPEEIAYVQANLGWVWRYEGPAYSVAQ